MAHRSRHDRPTIGVLAGWQYYWTATPTPAQAEGPHYPVVAIAGFANDLVVAL